MFIHLGTLWAQLVGTTDPPRTALLPRRDCFREKTRSFLAERECGCSRNTSW